MIIVVEKIKENVMQTLLDETSYIYIVGANRKVHVNRCGKVTIEKCVERFIIPMTSSNQSKYSND